MKLLILGGTLYLGRHTVEAARARGHEVTLFNRGRTNPDLFPDLERLKGDREHDLGALRDGRWDTVIDLSGYKPSAVQASCDILRDAAEHCTFVSSISVYADATRPGIVETDAVAEFPDNAPEELDSNTYGGLKALCERKVLQKFEGRSAIVRAGLIFGPHDATERSGYWPRRVAGGGEVLAPGRPERPVQLVDVRDLAAWLVHLAETRTAGVYNATGPAAPLTMQRFLDTCRAVADNDARLVWVDEAFLMEQQVGPYSELPLWVPEELHAFGTVAISRAVALGLKFRPLEQTVRDTLEWVNGLPAGGRESNVGRVKMPRPLTADRERDLLSLWRERFASRGHRAAGESTHYAEGARP